MASFYNPEASVVPYQMLPIKKKNKEWRKSTVDAFIAKFYSGNNNNTSRKLSIKTAYNLYNSIFDEKDLKYVTDPYKVNDSFPASLQNFNIIKPKIDLLMGEETKRPFSFKVAQTNPEATTKYQDKYKELLLAAMIESVGTTDPNKPPTPEELEEFMKVGDFMHKDYSDVGETLAYHTLNYLVEKEDIKFKFTEGFHDLLCSSMEVFYTGQINGEPILERVNPLYFSFDYSPEVKFIEDGDWAVRRMRMTPSAVYDRFYDLMDESDLKELLQNHRGGEYGGKGDSDQFNHIRWRNIPNKGYDDYDVFTGSTLDVWHVTWKSLKKVGFLKYIDPEGELQEEMVDESYIKQSGDNITWDWVTETWEGHRIGDGIYIGIMPIPEQSISVDNPNNSKLPYTGMVHNNNNTSPKSLVEIMKPLQYMYIVIWYRLELAIARDKGKVLNMDVTQIPKSMGVDINKWLHYLSSTGINLINPYEDGFDIPSREGGKPASFNQFSQVDLTMSQVINEYIGLMNKIEEMIGEISGVSRQRQGQVQSSELVGNVQQTIVQSSHITESLFYAHTQIKKRTLNNLLNIAKNVWNNSDKKKLNYITSDTTRIFMDVTDDFLYSDFDIFVTDSTNENRNIEMLKNLYQPAMQNGASLSDIAEIMASNNLTDIKNKLKKLEEKKAKQEQAIQQQQQEAILQAEQMKKDVADAQIQIKLAEIEQKETDSVRDSETAIEVALINNENKATIEGNKQSIEKEKISTEANLKQKEIEEKTRAAQAQEDLKKIEIRTKPKQIK